MTENSNKTPKPKALIPTKEFARRLGGCCTKTIERMIERGAPGMPSVVWINRQKFFEEAAVDDFIAKTISRGMLPQQKPYKPAGAAARRAAEAKTTARRAGQAKQNRRRANG